MPRYADDCVFPYDLDNFQEATGFISGGQRSGGNAAFAGRPRSPVAACNATLIYEAPTGVAYARGCRLTDKNSVAYYHSSGVSRM